MIAQENESSIYREDVDTPQDTAEGEKEFQIISRVEEGDSVTFNVQFANDQYQLTHTGFADTENGAPHVTDPTKGYRGILKSKNGDEEIPVHDAEELFIRALRADKLS